jgi:hypothetical protein
MLVGEVLVAAAIFGPLDPDDFLIFEVSGRPVMSNTMAARS